MTGDITPEYLRNVAVEAAVAGAAELRRSQVYGVEHVETKADNTLVTEGDFDSETAIKQRAAKWLPNVPHISEESAVPLTNWGAAGSSRYIGLSDPADGTAALAAGIPSSMVGVGYYDRLSLRLVAAAVVSPICGMVTSAYTEARTQTTWYYTGTWRPTGAVRRCQVWNGNDEGKGMILFDHARSFTRSDPYDGTSRLILADEEAEELLTGIARMGSLKMFASNLAHQRAVAVGGHRVIASVTTAVGGPWDLLGALLVLGAGGVARGYRIDRPASGTEIVQVPALDIFNVDVLVTANSPQVLERLDDLILETFA